MKKWEMRRTTVGSTVYECWNFGWKIRVYKGGKRWYYTARNAAGTQSLTTEKGFHYLSRTQGEALTATRKAYFKAQEEN